MKRLIALGLCALMLAGCATTAQTKLADTNAAGAKPPADAKILIVQPDISLSLLTAAGLPEPRADWSAQGRDNIDAEIKSVLSNRSHPIRTLAPASADDAKMVQLLKLHEAVGQSIRVFNYGLINLPTKKGSFDWTLGEGAQALGTAYDADYALFTYGRGSYASAGRKAAMAVGLLLGVSVPLGGQDAFASLIDLKTGRVVWFNVAHAGPNDDMRTAIGAKPLVVGLLKDAPL